MNRHIRTWTKIFRKTRSPLTGADLAHQLQRGYARLKAEQPRFENRYLQAQWEQVIAPGLALYQALLTEDSKEQHAVLKEVETLFEASFYVSERRLLKLLNLLSDPFPLVRSALRQMTVNHYLPGASEVIEDSRDCFAVNTYRCFILDTLKDYQAAELTALFCKTDDWLAASLTNVDWIRTETLASGGDLCGFRWCRRKR
jgi:hypothetical protein